MDGDGRIERLEAELDRLRHASEENRRANNRLRWFLFGIPMVLALVAAIYFIVVWALVSLTDMCIDPWRPVTNSDGVEVCEL